MDSTLRCDVAVVGGGFTGLWTAYYLLESDPSLRVVVLEAETAGFGASGRNGGWCSALFPTAVSALAQMPGSSREAALTLHDEMVHSIGEIERVMLAEGIDASFRRGGTVVAARTRAQLVRARREVEVARSWGLEFPTLLSADETRARLRARSTLGGTYTPDCARIHPLRLVRGLADAVERRGGEIYEHTRVAEVAPGRAVFAGGVVEADVVVRATEGYTGNLPGMRREVAPVYSLIVATEPLPGEVWDEIGLAEAETFSDYRHVIIYGQRTADERLVLGGRGAPYHWGSSTRPAHDDHEGVFAKLRETAAEMFPVLSGTKFSHAWGGPLGIARDWCATVGREGGYAWAGGYVGDGVSTTNLAGRTLRDLILERDTELTRLPWVNHRSRRWEPEPLRWLGVNSGLAAMAVADAEERLTGRPSVVARAMSGLVGGH